VNAHACGPARTRTDIDSSRSLTRTLTNTQPDILRERGSCMRLAVSGIGRKIGWAAASAPVYSQNHFGLMRACTAAREANVQVCLPTCRASSCSSVLLLDTSTLSPKADISQAPHLCIRGGPCRGNGVVGPELVARRPMKLGCYGGRWTPRCWTTRYSPATLRFR
jgi:hypothetical protein